MNRVTYTLYSLGALLHASGVKACSCPTHVTTPQPLFPIIAGETLAAAFAPLLDACAVPNAEADSCTAPEVCNCVDADFVLPTPNFVLDRGIWKFQVTDTEVACANAVPTCLQVACMSDSDCTGAGEQCCPNTNFCELDTISPSACGDPHMTGFLGQKFDFTGEDGSWYALVSDLPSMHINMRVSSPVPSLPEITYITGLSVITTDGNGAPHSAVITVKDPHNLSSSCPKGVSPCLADGSLSVLLDGEETLAAPGSVTLGPGVTVTAANLPGQCRSFGFEKYWEKKKLEYAAEAGRRLGESMDMGEWILADPTATNMGECTEYVARAMLQESGLFAHQSEHASFQIATPKATIRLSHGRLHQLAQRDPTDRFDLPDHITWQMNLAIDRTSVSRSATGVLGETFEPTTDATGVPIMNGMEAIRGMEEDYLVSGPIGTDFAIANGEL